MLEELLIPFRFLEILSTMLYSYNSQTRPKMGNCCHIWCLATQFSLLNPDKKFKSFCATVLGEKIFSSIQSFSYRRIFARRWLFYRY